MPDPAAYYLTDPPPVGSVLTVTRHIQSDAGPVGELDWAAPSPPAPAGRGPRWFDVRSFGAAVDGTTDDTAAWQAAVAAAAGVAGDQTPAAVYCPVGTSRVSGTITLPSHVDLVGEGFASQIFAASFGPLVQLGGRLRDGDPGDSWAAADHYVDLFGVLDSSVAAAAGQKFGYDLADGAYLSLPASPFELGPIPDDGTNACDNWRTCRTLTLDVALHSNGPAWFYNRVLGTTEAHWNGVGRPFALGIEFGRVVLRFTTADGQNRVASCPLGDAAAVPLLRLTVQVDLGAPSVAFFVNRTAAEADLSRVGLGWGPGLNFAENHHHEFVVGRDPFSNATGCDYRVLGLAVTAAPVYAAAAPGGAQARVDGEPLTDRRQFYPTEFGVGALCNLEPAAAPRADRLVPWQWPGMNYLGYGHFLPSNFNGAYGTVHNRIAGLFLNCSSFTYGSVVHQASALDTHVENVRFGGLGRAWSSLAGQISYTTRMRGVHWENNGDCHLFAWNTLLRADVRYTLPKRHAVKAHLSDVRINGPLVNGGSVVRALARLSRSSGEFTDWLLDFENGLPAECYFSATAHVGDYGAPGKLILRRVTGASKNPGTPYVRLTASGDLPGAAAECLCRVEDSFDDFALDSSAAVVETDSPLWRVEFAGSVNNRGVPLTTHADPVGAVRHSVAGDPARHLMPGVDSDALVPVTAGVPHVYLPGVQAVLLSANVNGAGNDGLTPGAVLSGWHNPVGAAAVAAGSPALAAGWRGLPCVRFPESYDSYFTLPGLAIPGGEATLFFVHGNRQSADHPNPFYIFDNNSAGSVRLYGVLDVYGGQPQKTTLVAPSGLGVPQVTCARVAAGSVAAWVNRRPAGAAAIPPGAVTAWDGVPTLGAAFGGTGRYVGDVYACVIVAGPLSDAACLAQQQRLMHEFRIPL